MNKDMEDLLATAFEADAQEDYAKVVAISTILAEAEDPWQTSGLLLRSRAYEYWTDGPTDALNLAVNDCQALLELAKVAPAYQNLARVLMKQGPGSYPQAFEALQRGAAVDLTPELLMGYAYYYRTKATPDLLAARSYYLRAGLRGRTKGLYGFSETSQLLGMHWSFLAGVVAAAVLSPVYAVFIGWRRNNVF